MNEHERQALAEEYLRRLDRALQDVPAPARRELLEDVRNHVEEAWAASPDKSRVALLNILDRLGEPEALAREERERLGLNEAAVPPGPDLLAVAAIVLTVLFWPVGILLAWLSPRWASRDKLVATALPIVGLALMLLSTVAATTAFTSQPVVTTVEVTAGEATAVGAATPGPQGPSAEDGAGRPMRREVNGGLRGVLVRALALYGVFGTPLTAALYLALRMRPHPRRAAVLIPVVVGVLAVFVLFVSFLQPVAVETSSDSRTAVQVTVEPLSGGPTP